MPVVLCEINDSNGSLTNSYFYADGQVLCQQNDSGYYYYVHDRLGSIRLVVNENGGIINSYTYNPFGEDLANDCNETVYNPFKYTGQWYDDEIGQYYLRARMYDPALGRFTSRDPVLGKQARPLTLHKYLYCGNDSINRTDKTGRLYDRVAGAIVGGAAGYAAGIGVITYGVATNNKDVIDLGVNIGRSLVAAGMFAGGVLGPNIGQIKSFLVGYISASALSAATGQGRADMMAVLAGDPNPPQTLAGWNLCLADKAFSKLGWYNLDDLRNKVDEILDW